MKRQKRKIIFILCVAIFVVLTAVRIAYVNRTARLPEVKRVPQGQSAEYKGLRYTVVSAELWNYVEYFEAHEELASYRMEERTADDTRILIVEYQVDIMQEDNRLDFYIPIQYAHMFNGIDPFMTVAMNPSVGDGTFSSGDIVTIPYEIYRENLTPEQWDAVNSLDMEYQTVLGTYPVKTEMQIEEVCP